MPQVQVAIGFGREAGNNRLVLARVDVGLNNFLQKIQTLFVCHKKLNRKCNRDFIDRKV
jgi:hypothetical protein